MTDFRIAGGYVEVTTRLSREQIHAAAQEATREFDAASGDGFEAAGHKAGSRFARSVEGRLRDEKGRFVSAGDRLGEDLGAGAERGLFRSVRDIGSRVGDRLGDTFSGAGRGLSNVADGFGKVASSAATAGQWIGYAALAGAGLEVVPPVIYAIAGALASLPALAVGAGAALATIGLGTQGIGAAIGEVFNPRGGGGGGGASQIDQMARAERQLATAQRDEREAQDALNDARRQAAFDLEDLNLQLRRSHTDEKSAALAVLEARQTLMRAQAGGDELAIQRARIGLEQASESLDEAKQHTKELEARQEESATKGVEGSDRVRAAQDRLTNATNAVKDAQDAVKQAHISAGAAGAAAATAYSKLSPEAKKFVDEIARLKPELVGLQQFVQDRMFAGLDKRLDAWAHIWIPDLRKNLGLLATDANQFAIRLGDDLSKPEFVGAVDKVVASMDRVFDRFTNGGVLDKLVTSFGDLVDKATPFVEDLANFALDKLSGWADSIDRAAKSGALDRFFAEAAKDAKALWEIGEDVFAIISDILDIAMGEDTSRHGDKNGLERLRDTLDHVKTWAESEGGQQTIKDIVDGFLEVADAVETVVGWLAKAGAEFDELAHSGQDTRESLLDDWHSLERGTSAVVHSFVGSFLAGFRSVLDGADWAFSWVPGLGPKLDKARKDFARFVDDYNRDTDRMKSGKDFTITIHNAQASGTSGHGAQGKAGALNRWGGVRMHAAGDVKMFGTGDAGIYPEQDPPIWGMSERGVGAELWMPRNGDPDRNRALAAVAAQWAGLQVVQPSPVGATPLPAAQSAAAPTQHGPYYIQVGDRTIVALVIDAITGHPTVVSEAAQEGDRLRSYVNSGR